MSSGWTFDNDPITDHQGSKDDQQQGSEMKTEVGTAEIPVELYFSPETKSGYMNLRIADAQVTVTKDDTTLGYVSGCIGGNLEIAVNTDKGTFLYVLTPKNVWDAVAKLHDQRTTPV